MRILVLVCITFLTLSDGYSQNLRSGKNGFHYLYLSNKMLIVKDSTKAKYKQLEFFVNGNHSFIPTKIDLKGEVICDKKNVDLDNKIELLDGVYKFYNRNGLITHVMTYLKGKKIGVHKYFDSNGLYSERDYNSKCNDIKESFLVRGFDSKKNILKWEKCIAPIENRWEELKKD